ncbi:MAG: hypothetical protein HQL52_10075 [Magnetococcales bacterium]|nr:hypothetical protein [Magnetococcales bacterium]
MPTHSSAKGLIAFLSLLLIMMAGWFARMDDLADWSAQPERAFYAEEPLLRGADGYYYLDLGRDLLEGTYEAGLPREGEVQHTFPRPERVPLLGVMIAKGSEISAYSPLWVAALIPAFLGPLLAIPLFLLGRALGGVVMGLSGAFLGIISPFYVQRSSLGWCDTDVLNVTWLMGLVYCFLRFSKAEPGRGYGWLGGALTVYGGFVWWWEQAPAQITAIFLFLLVLAGIHRPYRQKREQMILAGTALLALGMLGGWLGFDYLLGIPGNLLGNLTFFSKSAAGGFPNLSASISEFRTPTFDYSMRATSGNPQIFLVSGIGLALLLWQRRREGVLFLLPAVGLGLWGLLFTQRFLIFLGPVMVLGYGYLLQTLLDRWGDKQFRTSVALVILGLGLAWYQSQTRIYRTTYLPGKFEATQVQGMVQARELVSEQGVIWAWWDFGHLLRYWTKNRVISDGHSDVTSGEHIVYTAIPLATADQRLAANFIRFYAERGREGMQLFYRAVGGERQQGLELVKGILAAGPQAAREMISGAHLIPQGEWRGVEGWLDFFFPASAKPSYLFLPGRMLKMVRWWYPFGSWDIDHRRGEDSFFKSIPKNVQKVSDGGYVSPDGTFRVPADSLNQYQSSETARWLRRSDKKLDRTLLMLEPDHEGFIMNLGVERSTLIQLMLLQRPRDGYFTPLLLEGLDYQLWEVHPDPRG